MRNMDNAERDVRDYFRDSEGKDITEGIYLIDNLFLGSEESEIDVYDHPVKGLCCFSEDFGSGGTGVDDRYDCHVSIQFSGLYFVRRVGDLK